MSERRWVLGDRVRVQEIVDEEGDERYVGHSGTVTNLVTDGCGATPEDPIVVVTFDEPVRLEGSCRPPSWGRRRSAVKGTKFVRADGFWSEELVAGDPHPNRWTKDNVTLVRVDPDALLEYIDRRRAEDAAAEAKSKG